MISSMIDLMLPRKCALCMCRCPTGFCTYCRKLLPWITTACKQCGSSMPHSGICGTCQTNPKPFQSSVIPFLYQPPVSEKIQSLKYSGRLQLASAFGHILATSVSESGNPIPDIIIPVPLHWRRMCSRGFNQSTEIARVVGKQLGVPISTTIMTRSVNTATQTDLDIKMRLRNTRNAFKVKANSLPAHIALLDDVVTTGSTVKSASETLLKAGATKISVWAVATT